MFEFIAIASCLMMNAVLSCLEMAFVTVSRPHLKKLAAKGQVSAQRILNLKERPERVLSVLQIGITLVGAISAAVGGAGAEAMLSPFLIHRFGFEVETAKTLAIIIVVIPLTYLSVVIGELVPKTLALKYPLRFSLLGGPLLQGMDKAFAPFVWLLEISTRLILNPLTSRMKSELHHEGATTIDIEPLNEAHKQYVINMIEIEKRTVRDILVAWDTVTTIHKDDHFTRVLETIRESRHTRIPVIEEGKVVGILHAKEFISENEISKVSWNALIHAPFSMEHTTPILTALRNLQASKSHLAIVTRKAEVLGVVTIEDIFEEVVGEMLDEDDSPRALLSSNSIIRTMR